MPPTKQFLKRLDDEFTIRDVGSTLLEDLAKGLYQPEEVIREYVQNGIDAHRQWIHEEGMAPEGPIQLELGADRVTILDYGIGMDETEVRRVKAIAVSPKRSAEIPLTGHKGVGVWAGLSYFESLTMYSTKRGESRGYQLHIDFKGIVNDISDDADIGTVLNRHYHIDEFEAGSDEHYTDVTLEQPMRARDWFLDADKIREAVRRFCPCEIDPTFVFHDEVTQWYDRNGLERFSVVVDGTPVYRSYPSAVEDFTSDVLSINDKVVARYWGAVSKKNRILEPTGEQLVGFRVIQNGFVLGNENLYSEDMPGWDRLKLFGYLRWHVGEIHVVTADLRPDLRRGRFEESEIARQFIRKLRDWYQRSADATRLLSEVRNRRTQYEEYEHEIDAMEERGAPLTLIPQDRDRLYAVKQELADQDTKAAAHRGGKALNEKIAALKKTKTQRGKILARINRLLPSAPAAAPTSFEPDGQSEESSTTATAQPAGTSAHMGGAAASPAPAGTIPPRASTFPAPAMAMPLDMTNGGNDGPDETTGNAYVPVDVVFGLLEEILAEELSLAPGKSGRIIHTLRTRLGQVTANAR